MTRIEQHIDVAVRCKDVPKLAERYLESLPYSARDGAHTVLRAWVAHFAVECEVLLKISPRSWSQRRAVLDVHWRPLGDGPYPTFTGTLCAEEIEAGWSRLDLDGEYAPPGGIVGAAFDAVLGHRIAAESVHDLLNTLKTAFEELAAAVPLSAKEQ
jgi:hypothetical protein